MASVNKVILVGNLGADPELRYSTGGSPICNIRLATTESWKDKATGVKREQTEWHRVVLYKQLAEIAGRYLKKGSQVFVEGRLKTRKWQDRSGVERFTTEIEASELTMLGGKSGEVRQPLEAGESRDFTSRVSEVKGSAVPPDWLLDDNLPF